jgi:hypothetical protein
MQIYAESDESPVLVRFSNENKTRAVQLVRIALPRDHSAANQWALQDLNNVKGT